MHPIEKAVRQFHESWDMRDPDRGAEVIASDCDFEDIARGEKLTGKEAYKADYYRLREAFPDGLCKVENVIDSQCGEWATVEFRNTGTHTGVLRSSLGASAPTGKRAEVRYCSVMRVKGGMVVEGRDYYDSATFWPCRLNLFYQPLGLFCKPLVTAPSTKGLPDHPIPRTLSVV
jgi:ketosteroid isomerase-like protein